MPAIPRDTQTPLPRQSFRHQQTLLQPVVLQGVGFLTGSEITLELHPADANAGIAFQRRDLPGTPAVPAGHASLLSRQRRTAIGEGEIVFELVEHVLAALAGMQVDNCLVSLDASEPPGFDGSCRQVVDAILAAGLRQQDRPRPCLMIDRRLRVGHGEREIKMRPGSFSGLSISYHLDYGPGSPIPPQNRTCCLTPELFATEIAGARTFVLESEVAALQAAGYGQRLTHADLLVYGPDGPIDNPLRHPDECARHKILDCVGDLALLGCDLAGHVDACCSGHEMNHMASRRLAELAPPAQAAQAAA